MQGRATVRYCIGAPQPYLPYELAAGGGSTQGGVSIPWRGVLRRVLGLGVTVALTFVLLWWPFCVYPHVTGGEDCVSSLGQASEPFADAGVNGSETRTAGRSIGTLYYCTTVGVRCVTLLRMRPTAFYS